MPVGGDHVEVSVLSLGLFDTLDTLQVDRVWNNGGWRELEDCLCQLAEGRLDNDEPLVLELEVWRDSRLRAYGPLEKCFQGLGREV